MTPEELVSQLLIACPNKEVTPILNLLNEADSEDYIKKVEGKDGLDLFSDYTIHSLPMLYYIANKLLNNFWADRMVAISKIVEFLEFAKSEDLIYAVEKLAVLASHLERYSAIIGKPVIAVYSLQKAILKIFPTGKLITPLHTVFLKAVLRAKCYKQAIPVLKNNVTDLTPTETSGLSVEDVLLYFYYGGMVQIGLKNFASAYEFFENASLVPSKCASAIQIESYKKWILVSLIEKGVKPIYSRLSPSFLIKQLQSSAASYIEFANEFESLSIQNINSRLVQYTEEFNKDKNFGLAKQCVRRVFGQKIQKLTKIYMTLSIKDICNEINSSDDLGEAMEVTEEPERPENRSDAPLLFDCMAIEKLIAEMIYKKEITAKLSYEVDSEWAIVSFIENTQHTEPSLTTEKLQSGINGNIQLQQDLFKLEKYLATHHDLLKKKLNHSGMMSMGFSSHDSLDSPDFNESS